MAVPIATKVFVDGMKYLWIIAVGCTFYSQNTLLAVLTVASGCKKCSHILRRKCIKLFLYRAFLGMLLLNMSLEIYVGIMFCFTLSKNE